MASVEKGFIPSRHQRRAGTHLVSALSLPAPEPRRRWWTVAADNFRAQPATHLLIPVSAALVGWLTNWLAVEMIFWPLEWLGIPIYRVPGEPFGLLGWQGIVPAKSAKMAGKMVDVTISRLLSVTEAFGRLDPKMVAWHLRPTVARALQFRGPFALLTVPFTRRAVRHLLRHIEEVADINAVVVKHFATNKATLVELFQRVGGKELRFLVNSGTYFGFLLGVVQMGFWMVYPAPGVMPVAGAVVGTLTNWIALKWIFEPVRPTQIGPVTLQGMFLRRQAEVSDDFCKYVSLDCLYSGNVWREMLHGERSGRFQELLAECIPLPRRMARRVFRALQTDVGSGTPHPLHEYCDEAIGMRWLLSERMKLLTPEEFENVMHPVFQEDELTLIVAGAVLGAAAGYLQLSLDRWWAARRQPPPPPLPPLMDTTQPPAPSPP